MKTKLFTITLIGIQTAFAPLAHAETQKYFYRHATDIRSTYSPPVIVDPVDPGSGEIKQLEINYSTPSNAVGVYVDTPLTVEFTAANLPNSTRIDDNAWVVSGNLPDGVTAAATATGFQISGTPTALGSFPITINATDSFGRTASASYTINVGHYVDFLYFSGREDTVGRYTGRVSVHINARAAGNHQYVDGGTYSLHSGELPAGLTIKTAENASFMNFEGYPTEIGVYDNIVVALTDSHGVVTLSQPFKITVTERADLQLTASPSTTRTLQQNVDDAAIKVTAFNYADGLKLTTDDWTVTGLPEGLTHSVDSSGNLAITGKATALGNYQVTVSAKDSRDVTESLTLNITVTNAAPTFNVNNYVGTTVTTVQNLTINTGNASLVTKATLKSNSSPRSVEWALVSGEIPDGLTPITSEDGSILSYTGAPTTPGTYSNIVWMATDATGAQVVSAPVTFTVQAPFKQISMTLHTTCGVTETGALKCWGDNTHGQIGDGTRVSKNIPTDVSGLTTGVQSVSAGWYHTCAIMDDTSAYCWGSQSNGALGNGNEAYAVFSTPQRLNIGGETGFAQIAASEDSACAVKTDGSLVCWGNNIYGQLGNGSYNKSLNGVIPAGMESDVKQVVMGVNFTCALKTDGSVKCWGMNNFGQLGDGTGAARLVPTQVSGLTSGVKSISAGAWSNQYGTACAHMEDGRALCWGRNNAGQIGDGTTINRVVPTPVSGGDNVLGVQTAMEHSCIQRTDRTLACFGINDIGRLGTGNTTHHATPTPVLNLGPVKTWTTSSYYNCAILDNGQTKCWGGNSDQGLGIGPGYSMATSPIALN